jgi:hypothetical protein
LIVQFRGIFANHTFPLPSAGAWHHCAIASDGVLARAFLNGAQVGVALAPDQTPLSANWSGAFGYLGNHAVLAGGLDDWRYTRTCRYTSDFTPSPCVVGEGDPYWSDVAFLLTGESSRWATSPLGVPTEDPRAVLLPPSHNWAEGSEVTIARPVDVLDPGVGLRHTRPSHDGSVMSWSQREILGDAADLMAFRAFLQVHRGSAISFYAGPPGATIEVRFVVGGQVRTAQARFLQERPPAGIAILTAGGWSYYGVGEGVTAPNTIRIANGAASHPFGTILAARAIYRARLLGDAVEINYRTPGVAEVSLPLVAVAQ